MRQHVYNAGIDGKERIELIGNMDSLRFYAEQERIGITLECIFGSANNRKSRQIILSERTSDLAARCEADAFEQNPVAKRSKPAEPRRVRLVLNQPQCRPLLCLFQA